uniref:CSON009315 protein n=1 Tax=Culicoides sonorensis TaxID=179676 RepID=A0A336M5E8_CULSO
MISSSSLQPNKTSNRRPSVTFSNSGSTITLKESDESSQGTKLPKVNSSSTLVTIPEEQNHHNNGAKPFQENEQMLTPSRRRSSISMPKLFKFGQQPHRTSLYSLDRKLSEPAALEARRKNRRNGNDALSTALSALYAKFIVILGVALPLTEILSHRLSSEFYQLFYLYLYTGSSVFVGFVYFSRIHMKSRFMKIPGVGTAKNNSEGFGSFYLRVGAIAFGIGAMVYSGLEFGQYFEMRSDPQCGSIFVALIPAMRMILTLTQMQFIFLNSSDFDMGNHKVISRFGLMHLVATNICEWLFILIEETKHEIHHIVHHDEDQSHPKIYENNLNATIQNDTIHDACGRTKIMGRLVQDVAPFLYPCTIEYSLICAVILYEMWKKVKSLPDIEKTRRDSMKPVETSKGVVLSVDCSNSHRGIFSGVIIFVLTIISMIMYFVLHDLKDYETTAIQEVSICELVIYLISIIAIGLAMYVMRDLKYYRKLTGHHASKVTLDCTLLVVAQFGAYLYSIFSIIGNYFAIQDESYGGRVGFVTEVFGIFQTSIQTLFILNSSWRRTRGALQKRKKPGREIITFLLIANMCMWLINTLIKGRAQFRPDHFEYFGLWAWTIIVHVSMPLSIFYRFHASICFFEIWKSTYKNS